MDNRILRFRAETTIEDLGHAARHRIRLHPVGVSPRIIAIREAGQSLQDLLPELEKMDPHHSARILGEILNNALEAVALLRLDPAGCMAIAAEKRKIG